MCDESERRVGNRLKRRRTVAWAAFTAARRVGTWLGGPHVVRAAAYHRRPHAIRPCDGAS